MKNELTFGDRDKYRLNSVSRLARDESGEWCLVSPGGIKLLVPNAKYQIHNFIDGFSVGVIGAHNILDSYDIKPGPIHDRVFALSKLVEGGLNDE